ncbi:hypothetical protein [Ferruginibacter sp.]|nr:hypothetical protein [Ferruginibacter sp.]
MKLPYEKNPGPANKIICSIPKERYHNDRFQRVYVQKVSRQNDHQLMTYA